jgi:hypothetical protein
VIQSDAAGIDQSEPLPGLDADESAGFDSTAPASDVVVAADVSPDPASSVAALERDFAAARRSFLAQPEPLKWIAGGANAFRIGPAPHSGHADGPSSWTPWMTSNRRPQAAQS